MSPSLPRYLAALAVAGVLIPSGLGVATGAWTDTLLGGGTGLAGGLFALYLVHRAVQVRGGPNALMGAVVKAIMVRMVLLGAGLLFSVVLVEQRPIVFVASFFGVHLVSQALEAFYVHKSGRARRATA